MGRTFLKGTSALFFLLAFYVERMRWTTSILPVVIWICAACRADSPELPGAVFQLLSPEKTGIDFINAITESDSLSILSYEYMYNGGGVAILDVNNDSLPDIYFTGNQVPDALFLNKGRCTFEDISSSAGIQISDQWSTGVTIVDINSDGYDDIYVCVGGPGNKSNFPNRLFVNEKDGTFKEDAVDYGLADPSESIQAVFFDYDKDNDLDMFLLNGGGFEKSAIIARPMLVNGENRNSDRLYRNDYDSAKGHPVYHDVSRAARILVEGFGLGVSVIDADNDTWPDVYVSNDYLSRDNLYINNRDGTFSDRALEYFPHMSHFSMGNDVGDINNDGLPDIVTVDMLPADIRRRKLMFQPHDHDHFNKAVTLGYGYQYMRNMLHLNQGRAGFVDIGQLAGIHRTDWSWAPLLADFDNDGYQDLYVTNGYGKDITDLDFVKFRQDASSRYVDPAELQKLFKDSLKLRPAVSLPDFVFRNEGNYEFSDQSTAWGIREHSISSGAAYADLDRDGDLDIVVNNMDKEAFIYQNTIDRDSIRNNYLVVALEGSGKNGHAIGATIMLYAAGNRQVRYQQVTRGFQSSVTPFAHFGLGKRSGIDSVIVEWPDGRQSIVRDVAINSTLAVSHEDATHSVVMVTRQTKSPEPVKFIDFVHEENAFSDFANQPLLMHGFSSQGPGIAVGDVNGDRMDDVIIGGAYQFPACVYIQGKGGKFDKRTMDTEEFEDLGLLLLDVDNDRDLDLLMASGGAERFAGNEGYRPRLYTNDGDGNFALDPGKLPDIRSSISAVASADFDRDGDIDVFLGGRVVPGKFPVIPESFLLTNNGSTLVRTTQNEEDGIKTIGMVTTACWTDFDNDSWPDLIIAGEAMRITVFKNNKGKLRDITDSTDLANSFGLWNSIMPVDIDNDGDMDYIAGNQGLNNSYRVSRDGPLEIAYADFDNNGSIDPVFSGFEDGVSYPLASLDLLTRQLPVLKKRLLHYRDFARTSTSQLLRYLPQAPSEKLQCSVVTSSLIVNAGKGKFILKPLPMEAQFAPVNGIMPEDIDLDGDMDILLVGGRYDTEISGGRSDASVGTMLLNDGAGNLETVSTLASGLILKGDARALVRVELANRRSLVLTSMNNDRSVNYVLDQLDGFQRLRLMDEEVYAVVHQLNGGRRKMEFFAGRGYLSQGSRTIILTPFIEFVELFDVRGKLSRRIERQSL
jgi:enediyne biosynthesis protein E4